MENRINKKITQESFKNFLIDYSPALVLIVIVLLNVFITPNFATSNTLRNVAIQSTSTIFIALGMTWVIASGGIDISVGSVMALSSIVSAKLVGLGGMEAILIGLLVGTLCGSVTGFIIAKFNIQPIIVTLPMMIAIRGLAQQVNEAKMMMFENDTYTFFGQYRIFGQIPVQVVIAIIIVIVMYFISNKMTFGKKVEAVGDNVQASNLVGINTSLVIIAIYTTSAFLAGLSGIIETARIAASDANVLGSGMELDAIAAVAIGGTSMSGGKPNIVGTVCGAIVIQVISTMVNMNGISYEYSMILKAFIIVVALCAQRFLHSVR